MPCLSFLLYRREGRDSRAVSWIFRQSLAFRFFDTAVFYSSYNLGNGTASKVAENSVGGILCLNGGVADGEADIGRTNHKRVVFAVSDTYCGVNPSAEKSSELCQSRSLVCIPRKTLDSRIPRSENAEVSTLPMPLVKNPDTLPNMDSQSIFIFSSSRTFSNTSG